MDVNGTRFHLYKNIQDWRRATLALQPADVTDWYAFKQTGNAPEWLHLDWNASDGLTLSTLLPRFPRGSGDAPLTPENRRGAAVDQYGNWYWISHDRRRIFWQPAGTGRAALYWSQVAESSAGDGSTPVEEKAGSFRPVAAETDELTKPFLLGGLAVTTHHYLVVGNVSEPGLLVFDLHAGGEPTQILLKESLSAESPGFEPFDMAPSTEGGVWVLDRRNRRYWAFDRNFQVKGHRFDAGQTADDEGFYPADEKASLSEMEGSPPEGDASGGNLSAFTLAGLTDPISIEAGPNETVLILDAGDGARSVVSHYSGETELSRFPLEDEIDVVELDGSSQVEPLSILAHDFVYAATEDLLYVVERDGNQAVAFRLNLEDTAPDLQVKITYLPMTSHGGRGLVGRFYGHVDDGIYYGVTGKNPANDNVVRWVKLVAIDRQRYQPQAIIDTPVLDGRTLSCVWHRVFVDGCIPPEASVEVWSRAHDDPSVLPMLPYIQEPALYLRNQTSEIPFYTRFSEEQAAITGVGTWELLCQQMQGRYGQIRLVLTGNGRVTPQIHAMRVYYPRFSYPKNYLPAAYLEDSESVSFLERMLANMEGTFTELEGELRYVFSFFDGRTAPEETLDWLAGWLGLIVDPIWGSIQQQRQTDAPRRGERREDRRRLFIRFARQLFERRGTPDGIKFALQLLLEPCLEELLDRMQRAAVVEDAVLRAELQLYGLPYPTPTTSVNEFETLLYDYLLALRRPSTIRIVERFQTRNGRALAAGDPTQSRGTGDEISKPAPQPAEIPVPTVVRALRFDRGLFREKVNVEVLGTGTADAVLNIFLDGTQQASTPVDDEGCWSFRTSLLPGRYEAVVETTYRSSSLEDVIVTETKPIVIAIDQSASAKNTFSLSTERIEADAHRFAVLVPETLSPEEEAMIGRIVNLEKPAHTHFEVRRYWDYYRVGEARMELDTILGESSRFTPMILERDHLAEGYLEAAHPFHVNDRLVIE